MLNECCDRLLYRNGSTFAIVVETGGVTLVLFASCEEGDIGVSLCARMRGEEGSVGAAVEISFVLASEVLFKAAKIDMHFIDILYS